MLAVAQPYPLYFDANGTPLSNGYLYFGQENMDPEAYPVTVYWDELGTQPAAQPIRTLNGMAVRNGAPAFIYSNIDYSLTARDSKRRQVLFLRSSAANASSYRGISIDIYRAFGIVGDDSDVTTALLNALQKLKDDGFQGEIDFAGPAYRISDTILWPPGTLPAGRNMGSRDDPTYVAGTRFSWYGPAGQEMFKFGYQTDGANNPIVVVGGGMRDIQLNGRAIAGKTLSIKDLQYAKFDRLNFAGPSQSAVYMTNSNGVPPTRGLRFDIIKIELRGGATQNAHGFHLDGLTGGSDGVTLSTVSRAIVEHANGDGVRIGKAGDAFSWYDLQTFRADVETGFGVNASSTDPGQIIGNHNFYGGIISGGIYVAKAGAAQGWVLTGVGNTDVNDGTVAVYGPGQFDVYQPTSTSGRSNGPCRIGNLRDIVHQDAMKFRRWDSANDTLHTVQGNYLTGGNYVGASIADAGQPGGAVRLTTGNVSGNVIYITDSPNIGAVGEVPQYRPMLHFIASAVSTAAMKFRIGEIGDLADPPINGIYIEADPAVDAHYQCICRSAGTQTAVPVSVLGIGVAKIQWRLEITDYSVTFLYRTVGNELWGVGATISTNIPTTPLSRLAWIKTTSAAQKSFDLYEWKLAFESEV
jgi:hypothetical protein